MKILHESAIAMLSAIEKQCTRTIPTDTRYFDALIKDATTLIRQNGRAYVFTVEQVEVLKTKFKNLEIIRLESDIYSVRKGQPNGKRIY